VETLDGLPLLAFTDLAELETWLREHHVTAAGLWVALAKKGSGPVLAVRRGRQRRGPQLRVDHRPAPRSRDEALYLQKITPRRPRCSIWRAAAELAPGSPPVARAPEARLRHRLVRARLSLRGALEVVPMQEHGGRSVGDDLFGVSAWLHRLSEDGRNFQPRP